MMDVFPRTQLRQLIETNRGPCVSIFQPTHRAGVEILQDPIRLKNLLRQAFQELTAAGLRPHKVKELLQPAQDLVKDDWFWRHQSDGLAVFRSEGLFRCYRLPVAFSELAVVGDRFHLKPLLPALTGDEHFYLLAVSQSRLRLLRGTRHNVGELDIQGLPESPQEALRQEGQERQLPYSAAAPAGARQQSAVIHGHGPGEQDNKERIVHYFRQVDDALRGLLQHDQAPLVLAGVDYLFPLYQEANTYPYLMKEHVRGSPDNLTAAELHAQGWSVVEPYFLKSQREAAGKYRQMAGTQRVSNDLKTIVPAASQGRIESLFVAVGLQQWGVFDASSHAVDVHREALPGDEDLLNLAAIQTYSRGGTVYALPPQNMPDEKPVAALFRY